MIASSDDPWIHIDRARSLAANWGSSFVDAGPHGHLNADSNLGWWAEGRRLADRVIDAAGSGAGRESSVERHRLLAINATDAAQQHYLRKY